jgi:hypothetical protein
MVRRFKGWKVERLIFVSQAWLLKRNGKMIRKAVFFCLMIVLLASCSSVTPRPTTKPTEIQETPTASPPATIDPFIPTIIPSPTDPSTNIIATPGPNEQVYVDPVGWYLVNFPAAMEPGNKPNVFWSYGNTFETGYLPELGYVSRTNNVCAWLANIELDPAKTTMVGDAVSTSCSVSSKPYDDYSINYLIYENPGTDTEHRFVYIKTTHYAFSANLDVTFSWTKPTPKARSEPGFAPPSPDDVSFWENAPPMPSDVAVTEYKLLPYVYNSPYEGELDDYAIPQEARPTPRTFRVIPFTPTPSEEMLEKPLKDLGYQIKMIPRDMNKTCPSCTKQIYRNGNLLFDHVLGISDVYHFSTKNGPITAFFVEAAGNIFLVQNDVVSLWYHNNYDGFHAASGIYATDFSAPILYHDELLWVGSPSGWQIHKSNGQVVFPFVPYDAHPEFFAKIGSDSQLRIWHNHWILTFGDFLVEDDEMINKKLGFQQIFEWHLVHDKPVYFFRKGPRLGLSYNDRILPLQYEDIAYALIRSASGKWIQGNSARILDDSARFYGRRNGVWYYVVVKFNRR